jgi:hypothetical protein
VTPTPDGDAVTYAWYFDGELATDSAGNTASISDTIEFGVSLGDVLLETGPHTLLVEVTQGSMRFSDQKIILASSSGTVGTIDVYDAYGLGPSGGYVFYENPNWETDNWRYLEAAPAEWSGNPSDPSYIFGHHRPEGTNTMVGTDTVVGTGAANTTALLTMGDTAYTSITGDAEDIYAGKVCSDYSGGGYDDWFLPSKDELNLMYERLFLPRIGGLSADRYWSSSEGSDTLAWYQAFFDGNQHSLTRSVTLKIRPIRAF